METEFPPSNNADKLSVRIFIVPTDNTAKFTIPVNSNINKRLWNFVFFFRRRETSV